VELAHRFGPVGQEAVDVAGSVDVDGWVPVGVTTEVFEEDLWSPTEADIVELLATPDHRLDGWDPGLVLGGAWENSTRLLFVQCDERWEALPRLGFGAMNWCPPPHVQAAFAKSWRDLADAYPVGVLDDMVLMRFDAPPTRPTDLARLVAQLQRYCPDLAIAYDDIGGPPGLARLLAKGPGWWGFWWD
jgi:hypothetical protein